MIYVHPTYILFSVFLSEKLGMHHVCHFSTTVEPCRADSPEMRSSTIMQTLWSVLNAISIVLHTDPLKCGHIAFPKADSWLGPNGITACTNLHL